MATLVQSFDLSMDLILSVIRYQSLPPEQTTSARLGVQGGTIGRTRENDLELPDPERWVSGCHARVLFRNGNFYLADTSKNGTFVNHAATPLTQGQEVELRDGDELSIGDYDIRVSIDSGEPPAAAPFDPFARTKAEHRPLPGEPSAEAAPDILDLVGKGADRQAPGVPVQGWPEQPEDWLSPKPPQDTPGDPGYGLGPPEAAPPLSQPDQTPDENAFFRPPEAIPEKYDIWADKSKPAPVAPETEPVVPEPKQPAQIPPEPEREQRAPHAAAPEAAGDVLKAFLQGLRTTGAPGSSEEQARFMRTAGELLREMTQGLMTVLMARASFKSELRLEVTTIQSVENNPFKFSVDVDDALDHLLLHRSRGFLPPVEAAHEGFDDIQAHEMAMIAGLRAALRAFLARFDPAELEQRFRDRSVLDNLLPMARKAKYWDLFTEVYQEVAADAMEDFLHLFGDAFNRAYEEQTRQLKQSRIK